jgi:hypothetical protein
MPWLVRHQPKIDWLARSVQRRVDFDVSEVFTHLLVAPTPHVAVVDRLSTTQPPQQVSDGPRCVVCATTVVGPTNVSSSRAREDMKIDAVEQRLPHVNSAVEQWLPRVGNAVEQGLPHETIAVEQGLPLKNATVMQRLPFADDSVAQDRPLRDTGVVESELPRLEKGEVSSNESSSMRDFALEQWLEATEEVQPQPVRTSAPPTISIAQRRLNQRGDQRRRVLGRLPEPSTGNRSGEPSLRRSNNHETPRDFVEAFPPRLEGW